MNEPHVGGGNPVVSSKGTTYFNDMLGTTVGAKSGKQYSAATLSAFGEDLTVNAAGDSSHSPFPVPHSPFFTGKPHVAGLGHAFLMRNYRASLGKWQTADPMGYPDGWNALAYCNNGVTSAVDLWGCAIWLWGDDDEDFTGLVYKDSETSIVLGTEIIVAAFTLTCGLPPPMKEYVYGPDGPKVKISGKANLFGLDIAVDYEANTESHTFQLEKYICGAKSHDGHVAGTEIIQLVVTASVSATQRRYCDPKDPNDESKWKKSKVEYHSFFNYEVRLVSRSQCME